MQFQLDTLVMGGLMLFVLISYAVYIYQMFISYRYYPKPKSFDEELDRFLQKYKEQNKYLQQSYFGSDNAVR